MGRYWGSRDGCSRHHRQTGINGLRPNIVDDVDVPKLTNEIFLMIFEKLSKKIVGFEYRIDLGPTIKQGGRVVRIT
jgi:hypothetical protein